jgi:protein-L-isoaspartate(D-aspartate) O-methyltransferase
MTSDRTRMRMIDNLRHEGVTDERVLGAMAAIPRHASWRRASLARLRGRGAADRPRPDDLQPTIVALMTQLLLEKSPMDKVLEVGTGCGYQTAVLGALVKEVYTLERIAPLMDKARRHLRDLRFYNVRYKHADGHRDIPKGALRRHPHGGLGHARAARIEGATRCRRTHGAAGGDGRPMALHVDRTEKGFVETRATPCASCPLLTGLA